MIVQNYSDLSPAMWDCLLSGGKEGRMSTMVALERRGYLKLGRTADEPFGLTAAGRAAVATRRPKSNKQRKVKTPRAELREQGSRNGRRYGKRGAVLRNRRKGVR